MTSNVIENYYDKETPQSGGELEKSAKRILSEESSAVASSPKRFVYDAEDGAVDLPGDAPTWVATVLSAIDSVKEDVNSKLDELTQKLDAYKSETCAQISAINTAVESMKCDYDKKIAELTESVTFVSKKYDDQVTTNAELADKISELVRSQDYAVQKFNQDLYVQGGSIEAQEQYSRRNCLLFHGVAETEDENTDAHVINTVKEHLGITLHANDLDRSHRLGAPRQDKRARPIIAKFSRYNVRASVYAAKRKLKGSTLLLTESLTKRRVEVLNAARRRFGNRNVWTMDGELFTKQDGKTVNVRFIPPSQ